MRKFWIKKALVFHNNLYADKTKSVTKICLKITQKKQAKKNEFQNKSNYFCSKKRSKYESIYQKR